VKSPIERRHGSTDFCVVKYTTKSPPSGAQKMKISNCTKDGSKHFSPKVCLQCFAGEMLTAAKQMVATAGKNRTATQHLSELEL